MSRTASTRVRRVPVDLSPAQAQIVANRVNLAGDAIRVRLLSILSQRELYVGALCEELGLRQPALSHHMTLLRAAGLIQGNREGKNVRYALTDLGWSTITAVARLGD